VQEYAQCGVKDIVELTTLFCIYGKNGIIKRPHGYGCDEEPYLSHALFDTAEAAQARAKPNQKVCVFHEGKTLSTGKFEKQEAQFHVEYDKIAGVTRGPSSCTCAAPHCPGPWSLLHIEQTNDRRGF